MQPHSQPFIVPVFLPHAGCPHRCVFCNQHSTTGKTDAFPALKTIRATIDEFLQFRRDNGRWTEISFYGGNFLGLPTGQIQLLLASAAAYVRKGRADGIRFSTRPDTIDPQRLELIAPFPVTTIEVGVQSLNDEVLRLSRRGHTAEQTQMALFLLKEQPYRIGAQIMVGLPGDTHASALATARRLTDMAPDFVRIYPTVVLKGSALARWYDQGRYAPLSLDAAVAQVADMYQVFSRHDIPVVRMGLQASADLSPEADLLAGPFHPSFGELVQSALWQDALSRHLEQQGLRNTEVLLEVNPRRLSQLKGRHDEHILTLIERHRLRSIEVRADAHLEEDTVLVNGLPCRRM
jgi:histone acetyltransferase (RNA polymerase elongator complex component)